MKLLRFYYCNHRGEGHVYVVEPMAVRFAGEEDEWHASHWVIDALVVTRTEGPKILDKGRERRSFKLVGCQSMTEIDA